uniref:Large ribosomal subunit protein uL18c n=1 Tax=Chromera velia CCMP2878 TaxID=1169474 RepID=A0A0G4HTF9_9ALVE|mmetsp:Transcript_1661/g.3413  ORF Transcript_1661/g.3413 Transcript_1661/m.3413 type:complete len:266 (-) Transcript_1661:637-1434(-)|eukprot:Cvel_31395.t1-p1 / transcript=Cvel_31395.t1 / gene=Cvel_31395 / organism=Chromera_velia_CCMP2878 / gene_product=Putative 50S ribosomal protein L18, apicoplast, putative / transcript_product=Putative 50S ribosomal protein L18, apicoplast, putative / location=Cvel_scaffold4671:1060-5080(-) / protein_length=265 / sequence_SO=supercontig / SO=protein_coding / is_pseudo=false
MRLLASLVAWWLPVFWCPFAAAYVSNVLHQRLRRIPKQHFVQLWAEAEAPRLPSWPTAANPARNKKKDHPKYERDLEKLKFWMDDPNFDSLVLQTRDEETGDVSPMVEFPPEKWLQHGHAKEIVKSNFKPWETETVEKVPLGPRAPDVDDAIATGKKRPRLKVSKTANHIYATIIDVRDGRLLCNASTLDRDVRERLAPVGFRKKEGQKRLNGDTMNGAWEVGKMIAKRALDKGIDKVFFDKNGMLYHGKIRAIAEGARAAGLNF